MNSPRIEEEDSASGGEHGHEEEHEGEAEEYQKTHEHDGVKYNQWIVKFRRFDRTFMRKWFGGNIRSSLLLEDQYEAQEEGGGGKAVSRGYKPPGSHPQAEMSASRDPSYLSPASGVWQPQSRAEEQGDDNTALTSSSSSLSQSSSHSKARLPADEEKSSKH